MIPALARKAILDYSAEGDVVLDPFAGCGTVLLESMLSGRSTIGIDTNPVSTLICRAKTNRYSDEDVRALDMFVEEFDSGICASEPMVPEYHNLGYWFDPSSIEDLGRIRAYIETLDGRAHDLALCVLSSLIVRISYQDSDTRYSRKVHEYAPQSAFRLYKSKMMQAIENVRGLRLPPDTRAEVHLQDGRRLDNIQDGSVSLIVTSPPYLNAYDYHKYHRHRIHWIGGDPTFTRTNEIGQHDQFTKKNATPDRYFEDMRMCFSEWHRVVKKDGACVIVVGDAIVSGNPVPVADLFIDEMSEEGFAFQKQWIRRVNPNKKSFNAKSRIDQEHVLLFRNKE